jgi:SAM-dependent methyltransferase
MMRKNSLISWVRRIIRQYEGYPPDTKGILSTENNPIIKAFVEHQIENPKTFNASISENDEMYLFALQHFQGSADRACIELLTTGKQSMDIVSQIVQWNFSGFGNISAFLDFACGYGRLTRFLTQELPPKHIWVCDIYEDAVKFQQKQFGVHGIVSVHNPEDFRSDRKYDCIFVASLFSHLPEKKFISWLKCLYRMLAPDGLLIFSVHDVSVLPPELTMGEKGIRFVPESESRSLDISDYGTTYVTESFVGLVIREITGGIRYYRMKRGLWWFQDLYVIAKNPDTDFRNLNISSGPPGYVDSCMVTDGNQILFEGWAADFDRDSTVKDIQIIVGAKLVKRCIPSHERPDIAAAFQDAKGLMSGFSCSIPGDIARPSDIVIIKVTNSRGMEHIIRIGTLGSLVT